MSAPGLSAPAGRTARPPVAAGLFYPAGDRELRRTVDRLLAAARPPASAGKLRALVVPHAGYGYSGAVAATAYAALPDGERPARVALLGPSHFVALAGMAVSTAAVWRTPLGLVPVDDELRERAARAGAAVDERPHARDHALEVQLPFLQRRAAGGLRMVPIAVGAGPAADVAVVISSLAEDALVVVSTDLSHYHDHAAARRLDRRTAEAVVGLDERGVGELDACGASALRGLLVHARNAGWTCTLLDLRTSADAGGPTGSVVGYGAFAFTAGPTVQGG